MAQWNEAIRMLACDLIAGEDIQPRAAYLSATFGVNLHTTMISIEETAELLAD